MLERGASHRTVVGAKPPMCRRLLIEKGVLVGVNQPGVHVDGCTDVSAGRCVTILALVADDKHDIKVVVAVDVDIGVLHQSRRSTEEGGAEEVGIPNGVVGYGIDEGDGIVFARFEIERRVVVGIGIVRFCDDGFGVGRYGQVVGRFAVDLESAVAAGHVECKVVDIDLSLEGGVYFDLHFDAVGFLKEVDGHVLIDGTVGGGIFHEDGFLGESLIELMAGQVEVLAVGLVFEGKHHVFLGGGAQGKGCVVEEGGCCAGPSDKGIGAIAHGHEHFVVSGEVDVLLFFEGHELVVVVESEDVELGDLTEVAFCRFTRSFGVEIHIYSLGAVSQIVVKHGVTACERGSGRYKEQHTRKLVEEIHSEKLFDREKVRGRNGDSARGIYR